MSRTPHRITYTYDTKKGAFERERERERESATKHKDSSVCVLDVNAFTACLCASEGISRLDRAYWSRDSSGKNNSRDRMHSCVRLQARSDVVPPLDISPGGLAVVRPPREKLVFAHFREWEVVDVPFCAV